MAEAEDVITDAARHATVYVQAFWRRHRIHPEVAQLELADVAARLDLLANAVFGRSFRLRPAQPPAARTWLDKMTRRRQAAPPSSALPATDGDSIWLPRSVLLAHASDGAAAVEQYRLQLLQQAMRAVRGSAAVFPHGAGPVLQACFHILEAGAADDALARLLPGMASALQRLRAHTLAARPPHTSLAPAPAGLEHVLRAVLAPAPGLHAPPAQPRCWCWPRPRRTPWSQRWPARACRGACCTLMAGWARSIRRQTRAPAPAQTAHRARPRRARCAAPVWRAVRARASRCRARTTRPRRGR